MICDLYIAVYIFVHMYICSVSFVTVVAVLLVFVTCVGWLKYSITVITVGGPCMAVHKVSPWQW